MITRPAASYLRLARNSIPCRHARVRILRVQCRRASASSAPPPANTAPQSTASALASLTSELDKLSPRFDVPAESITILRSPSDFFETLKTKIAGAQRRIYLSTLYIGKTEYELVSTKSYPDCIFPDAHRSTPFEMHSSATLI